MRVCDLCRNGWSFKEDSLLPVEIIMTVDKSEVVRDALPDVCDKCRESLQKIFKIKFIMDNQKSANEYTRSLYK